MKGTASEPKRFAARSKLGNAQGAGAMMDEMGDSGETPPGGSAVPGAAGQRLAPGLYIIATPIGAARDITLRALDILATAEVLAAEDTRRLRHLMDIHGVALNGRPLVAYHDHNEAAALPRLLAALRQGKSVAYASEAGTPLVSDPGFGLVRAAAAEGQMVLAAPGASAVLCALTVAGLPTDRFLFAGFVPSAAGERATFYRDLAELRATLIVYESPKRLGKSLHAAAAALGKTRRAAVCRELTKRFEEVRRGTLGELALSYESHEPKGEIVLVIDRGETAAPGAAQIDSALQDALARMSVRDAVNLVVHDLGVPRREIYQRALELTRI